MSLDDEVYACRDCRLGPRDNRVGWTDDDWERLWYVTPSTHPVRVLGRPVSVEVLPCAPHERALFAADEAALLASEED